MDRMEMGRRGCVVGRLVLGADWYIVVACVGWVCPRSCDCVFELIYILLHFFTSVFWWCADWIVALFTDAFLGANHWFMLDPFILQVRLRHRFEIKYYITACFFCQLARPPLS